MQIMMFHLPPCSNEFPLHDHKVRVVCTVCTYNHGVHDFQRNNNSQIWIPRSSGLNLLIFYLRDAFFMRID